MKLVMAQRDDGESTESLSGILQDYLTRVSFLIAKELPVVSK